MLAARLFTSGVRRRADTFGYLLAEGIEERGEFLLPRRAWCRACQRHGGQAFIVILAGCIALLSGRLADQVREIVTTLIAPLTTLVGSVVGFYFGDASPSRSGREGAGLRREPRPE